MEGNGAETRGWAKETHAFSAFGIPTMLGVGV